MNLGNFMLALAFVSGLVALTLYVCWARGRDTLRRPARLFAALLAAGVVAASVFQITNILTQQFQYEYVRNFSDRSMPTWLLVTTFWGGQAGSFLLWALWSVIFAWVLIAGLRRSSWEPFVLAPYLLITVCIVGIMWAAGPFTTLPETPADGNGLNPLLQNYWMAIHPPILFTGFTTMAGPFAFAIAALWRRDYDGWVRQARPWALLAWACLGTGLALGGFWAYESLGWGGFWGWDPVENSSFVPWLAAAALLHGLVLQGARGSFKRGNLALAITGELTVIYSTFLTRSGILGQFSVHSFVELGLMGYLVAFIAGFGLLGFGLLAWRWREVGRRVLYSGVLSREFGLLVSVTLFVVIMLIVGVGTSMPVISLLPGFASQVSVDLGWYGPTVAPFGLLLLVTMAVFPLLGWQPQRYGRLLAALKWPAVVTVISVFVALLLDISYPLALLFLAAAVFAIATNLSIIARIWKAGALRIGGYLCHIGVGLLFIGIVGTAFYKQSASLRLTEGVPQSAFGLQFTLRGMVLPPDDPLKRTALQVEVMDPARQRAWLAQTPYYVYPKTQQLIMHPAIQPGLWSDLYVAPSQFDFPKQSAPGQFYLAKNETKEILGYRVTFTQFNLPNRDAMIRGEAPPQVEAVLTVVAPDGTTSTVVPIFQPMGTPGQEAPPVAVPGGGTLAIVTVQPEAGFVVLQLGGIDLSAVNPDDLKATAFVEVSREPGIRCVWAGIMVGVLGGLLALVRRWRERRPSDDLAPSSAPLPRRTAAGKALQSGTVQLIEREVR